MFSPYDLNVLTGPRAIEVLITTTDEALSHWGPVRHLQYQPGHATIGAIEVPGPAGLEISPGVAMIFDSIKQLHLFGVGNDGAVWHARRGADAQDWSPWTLVGEPGGSVAEVIEKPGTARRREPLAVALNDDGRLEIYVVRHDYLMFHKRQTTPGDADWDEWAPLGRPQEHVAVLRGLCAPSGSGGEVLVISGSDSHDTNEDITVWHKTRRSAGGGWDWRNLTPAGSPKGLGPLRAVRPFADTRVFALDADGHLCCLLSAGQPDWFRFQGDVIGFDLDVDYFQDRLISVIVESEEGAAVRSWDKFGVPGPWSPLDEYLTGFGAGLPRSLRLARDPRGQLTAFGVRGEKPRLVVGHKVASSPAWAFDELAG